MDLHRRTDSSFVYKFQTTDSTDINISLQVVDSLGCADRDTSFS
jgi:hypothetical protein